VAFILQPWQVFLTALAGWINRHQQAAIDFLREENRVLLEPVWSNNSTDDQRFVMLPVPCQNLSLAKTPSALELNGLHTA